MALSSGVRRIVAVTGPKAIDLYQQVFNISKAISQDYKITFEKIIETINKQKDNLKSSLKEVKDLKKEIIKSKLAEWTSSPILLKNNINFYVVDLKDKFNFDDIRDVVMLIINSKAGIALVSCNSVDKISFVCAVSKNIDIDLEKVKNFLKSQNIQCGGNNQIIQGNSPDMTSNLVKLIQESLL